MPRPLLWRSFQLLREDDLRTVFEQLGIKNSQSSLIAATALGTVSVRPIELHRAVLAITLALAGKKLAAKTPTIIDNVTVQNQDGSTHEITVEPVSIPPSIYEQLLSPKVIEVLSAPIQIGTLRELSSVRSDHNGISLFWAKTGTFARGLQTQHVWIVGGLVIDGEPYSCLVLACEPTSFERSFGTANANAFAPFAKLLIEAAVRDQSQSKSDAAQPVENLRLK
jgi:hypothetical protein